MKKIISALTAFLCTVSFAAPALTANAAATPGDVNNDGKVDSLDATAILIDYAAELVGDATTIDPLAGDVNGDNKVDSLDATEILIYYAYKLNDPSIGPIEDFDAYEYNRTAAINAVVKNEDLWIGKAKQDASNDAEVDAWFADFEMDGTYEFIVGANVAGTHMCCTFYIYDIEGDELRFVAARETWPISKTSSGIETFCDSVWTVYHQGGFRSYMAQYDGTATSSSYFLNDFFTDKNYLTAYQDHNSGESEYNVDGVRYNNSKYYSEAYDTFFSDAVFYSTNYTYVDIFSVSSGKITNGTYLKLSETSKKNILTSCYDGFEISPASDAKPPLYDIFH